MTDNLKKELTNLLQNYPELKGSKLIFSGEDFSLLPEGSNKDIEKDKAVKDDSELQNFSVAAITGNSPKIEARLSKIHGYGVFAKEAIMKGEVIEQCRLLKLGYREKYMNDPVLADYIWGRNDDSVETKQHGKIIYLALGFGSIFNHSDTPNTVLNLNYGTEIMTVTTGQKIEKDEEIFVNYGNKYFLVRHFWKNVKDNQILAKTLTTRSKGMAGI